MTSDLSVELCELVDSVEPVTLDDLLHLMGTEERGHRHHEHFQSWAPGRRWFRIAAAAIVVATATVAASGLLGTQPNAKDLARGPLEPAAVRLVAESSTNALDSGTAQMNITQSFGGRDKYVYSVAVTFTGQNIGEAGTMTTYWPPLPPSTSPMNARVVDGNAYVQLGKSPWYVQTGPDAAKSLSFPDPRTLLKDISPSADLMSLGQASSGGVELTHLRATNPSALVNLHFAGSDGEPTAFDVWVDSQNVVQRMTMSSKSQSGGCVSQTSPSTIPEHCVTYSVTNSLEITFSDIGSPETVSIPSGAITAPSPSN